MGGREGGCEGGREREHTHLAICERDIFDALLLGKLQTAHLVMCVCVCVCTCKEREITSRQLTSSEALEAKGVMMKATKNAGIWVA